VPGIDEALVHRVPSAGEDARGDLMGARLRLASRCYVALLDHVGAIVAPIVRRDKLEAVIAERVPAWP
jgi:hypothetical protein